MNPINSKAHKNKYIGLAIVAFLAGQPASAIESQSAAGSLYAAINQEALSSELCARSLKAVTVADESQAAPESEGSKEKRRHFDGSAMPAGIAYINREFNRAVNLAVEADSDSESKADALRHFGLMLHTVQDFYLHTNYVELKLEEPKYKADPFNLPLVDWSRVPTGYSGYASGTQLIGYNIESPNSLLNKESVNVSGGKVKTSGGILLSEVARQLAVRETQRQWNLFETLISARCGGKSAKVLDALRHGDQSGQPEADKEDDGQKEKNSN